MTKEQVKQILDRVSGDDLTDEEWRIIEERAARHDLASDEEVEELFSRYRGA